MRQDGIVRVTTKLLIAPILLFGLYVQFHGDYGPGGGFQAGVIFAAAIIIYGLVFGIGAGRQVAQPRLIEIGAAVGVLLYGGVGVVCLFKGGTFLNYSVLEHDPVHGQHLGILLVELGVGITVTFVMLTIFYTFASRGKRR